MSAVDEAMAIARIERWIRQHFHLAVVMRFPTDDMLFVIRQLRAARAEIDSFNSRHSARLAVRGVPGFSVPQPIYEHSVSEADRRFCSKCGAFAEDGKCTIPGGAEAPEGGEPR